MIAHHKISDRLTNLHKVNPKLLHRNVVISMNTPCPTCMSLPGYYCTTKNGNVTHAPHAERTLLSLTGVNT